MTTPKEALQEAGMFFLRGELDVTSCGEAVEWILAAPHQESTPNRLQLIVSSWGGECAPAFGLVDAIRGSKIPIHTLGLGMVASAGLTV